MKFIITLSCLLLNLIGNAHANHDPYPVDYLSEKDYNNVRIRVNGTNLQFINQFGLIGDLVEKLCKKMNCRDSVLIDFCLRPGNNTPANFHIAYDSCSWINIDPDSGKQLYIDPYSSKIINIVASRESFCPTQVLQLLEYSILNLDKLKDSKHQLYERTFNYDYVNAIDTNIVNDVLMKELSSNIRQILETKIIPSKNIIEETHVKCEIDSNNCFYYYYRNNKYCIAFKRIYDNQIVLDTTLLEFCDLYDFEQINSQSVIVFDSNNSFYYLSKDSDSFKISKQQLIPIKLDHTIEGLKKTRKMFYLAPQNNISYLGGNLIAIDYGIEVDYSKDKNNSRHIQLLYQIDKDELIIDLEDFINKKKEQTKLF